MTNVRLEKEVTGLQKKILHINGLIQEYKSTAKALESKSLSLRLALKSLSPNVPNDLLELYDKTEHNTIESILNRCENMSSSISIFTESKIQGAMSMKPKLRKINKKKNDLMVKLKKSKDPFKTKQVK